MDNRGGRKIALERILIIKLSALGDIVQALPVLHVLKRQWKSCRVDWITGEVGAGLLRGHPLLNRVIVYPRKRLGEMAANPLAWPGLAGELRSLSRDLRMGRYDAALDLQGLFKSGLITYLSGAREKVGFKGGREASSLFLNRKLPKYDPDRHAVLRYLKVPQYLGVDTGDISFPLSIKDSDLREAGGLLDQLGIEAGRFVLLIPGTVWPSKHWSVEGFSRLSRLMSRQLGLTGLVVGSGADASLGTAIARDSCGSARDITGKTTLKLLAALSTMAAAAVTTDTGPMHLVAAAGLRVIALFGPTAPWRTGPFGKGHIILRKGLECSPCFNRQCSTRECMVSISPEEVLTAVREIKCSRG